MYLQHLGDFEDFVRDAIDLLTHEEQNRLYEMEMWIMNGEGVWVLDDTFIAFAGHVLSDQKTFSSENRVTFLRLLAYGSLHDVPLEVVFQQQRKRQSCGKVSE